jgi:hypothetical protein
MKNLTLVASLVLSLLSTSTLLSHDLIDDTSVRVPLVSAKIVITDFSDPDNGFFPSVEPITSLVFEYGSCRTMNSNDFEVVETPSKVKDVVNLSVEVSRLSSVDCFGPVSVRSYEKQLQPYNPRSSFRVLNLLTPQYNR